jgi:hypothetical protein
VHTSQRPFDAKELAEYRLTTPMFKRFAHATRLIVAAIKQDRRFERDPLVTRDISVSGDAAEMATALHQRLDAEPAFAGPLFAADMNARDYAAFAIVLIGARLAHGFVKSGAIRRVPAGVATDNVAFVDAHLAEISALLTQLGLE